MRTNARKYMSLLLCLCLLLSLLPASAAAAGETEADHNAHSDWTELTSTVISSGTLSEGSYYLTGNLDADKQQIKISGTVNLCLNGYTFTGEATDGVFRVGSGGTLKIYDCGSGGSGMIQSTSGHNPIFLHSGGACNLYGGTIQSTVTAVVIDDNDLYGNAGYEGDAKNLTGGTFTMYGGTVKSTSSGNQGINVNPNLTDAAVIIQGGTIESGRYGIKAASGTVTLSGNLDITGGTAGIYLSNDAKIIPNGITGGSVGVAMETPGVFTSDGGASYKSCFYSSSTAYEVQVEGNELKLATPTTHSHAVDGSSGSAVAFTGISDLGGALAAGSYNLTRSVTATDDITISGAVNLCLNGYELDLNGEHIIVNSGGSLTLCDCGATGKITGQSTTHNQPSGYGSVYVSGGSFTMYSGSISGNKTYSGGGVYVGAGGTFTMHGGSITGNTPTAGGGVFVAGGTFTMSGGSITGNEATGNGGGVFVAGGSFTMSGGSITGNEATNNGGGIYVFGGTFTLSGAPTITENTKNNAANNVYLSNAVITIGDALTGNSKIGVSMASSGVFTSGWSTHMSDKTPTNYFTSDVSNLEVQKSSNELCLSSGLTVSFNLGGAPGDAPPDQIISSGTAARPDDPTWEGHTFAGWYYGDAPWDFGTAVTASMTLTAKWITDPSVTVRGDTALTYGSGGTLTASVTPASGQSYAYQWYCDGVEIFGATGARYTIPATTAVGNYTYRCAVTASITGSSAASATSADVTVTVNAKAYGEGITVSTIPDQTCTGSPITPEPEVKFGNITLQKDRDYTLSYGENTNVGRGSVTITFEGNYSGKTTAYFNIVKANQAAPDENEGYAIDYVNETITVDSGYEVYTDETAATPVAGTVTPGATYYIRKAENANYNPSNFTPLPVADRPDAPDAPVVTGKTDTSLTISTEPGCEYAIGGGWVNATGSYTFENLTPGTEYTIRARRAATDSAFASEASVTTATTKTVPVAPPAPTEDTITVTDGSVTITGSESGQEYAVLPADQQPQESDWKSGGGDLSFDGLSAGTQYVVWTRTAGTDSAMPSEPSSVNVTTAAQTPADGEGYVLDYSGETISVNDGYEVKVAGGEWTTGSVALEPGKNYEVRKAASGGVPASASVSFTAASRPEQPGDKVTVTGETIQGKGDGQITVPADAEYKTADGTWTPGPAALENLAAGTTVTVRVKATASAPHGEEQAYTVPASAVTLTVTFEANGGSEVPAADNLSYNASITAPAAPTKSGYTFAGWYKEAACTNPWDFSTDKVTENLTLNAKWTLDAPSVTLSADNSEVTYGESITLTAAATHGASVIYTYEWYKDGEKLTNAGRTLTISTVADSGKYKVVVTATDSDGLTAQSEAFAEAAVSKAQVSIPAADTTTFTYNGAEQTYNIAESALYAVSGSTQTDAGSYTVTVSLNDTANYQWADGSTDAKTYAFVINKATPSLTVSAAAITYGQSLGDSQLTGSATHNNQAVSGSFTWQASDIYPKVSDSGVTGYAVVFTPDDTDNYDTVEEQTTVSVAKKTLTPFVYSVESKTYDGSAATTGTIALTGAVGTEQPTASGTFTFADANAGEGKAVTVTVALDGNWGDNYQLYTYELSATADIAPKTVGLAWSGHTGLVYDGKAVSVTAEATGLVGGDECAVTVTGGDKVSAGTYTATAAALSNANYALPESTQQTYTIAPRPVELSWSANSFTYDGQQHSVTATIDNLVPGDDCALTYADNEKTDAGSYTAEVTALGNANYTLAGGENLSFDWSIAQAAVSFTVSGSSHSYDGEPKTAEVAQAAGEAPIPEGGFSVSYDGEASQTEAGSYDITVTITDANFCFEDGGTSKVVGRLTISAAGVPIPEADTTTFTYNGAEQTYHIAESALYAVSGNVQTDAGSYTVTVSLADAENYAWSDGTTEAKTYDFVIAPRPVTATWLGLEQVYGDGGQVSVILSGLAGGDEGLTAAISGAGTEVGSYKLTASLKNYAISPASATLRIQPRPVTITLTGNAVAAGGTPSISAPGLSAGDYTVVYRDRNGSVTTPGAPGTYEVWVEITNPNYRHPDGSSEKLIGSVVVSAGTPEAYSLSFDAAGGSGSTAAMSAAGGSVVTLPECGFAREGYVFSGWQYGGVVYRPGDSFSMPYGSVTFTARWARALGLGGTVSDKKGAPVAGAAVSVWQGADKLGEAATGADGAYSFEGLAPGSYNVSASLGGKTVTAVVTVSESGAVTGGNLTLPEGNTSTRVEVTPGSPAIVVGELDRVFDSAGGEDYTQADAETVKNGGSVEIIFTADEKRQSEVQAVLSQLQGAAGGSLSLFLECTLEKEVYDSEGARVEAASGPISRSSVLLEVRLPLPASLQGKYSYTVSRIHEGEAQALSTSANSLGEYFELSADKSALILHVCCFSTYAVGYSDAPASLPTYAPVKTESQNGSYTVSPLSPMPGQTVTITPTPDAGYVVDRVTVTDASGKAVEVRAEGGKYSFTQPSGSVTITVTFRPAGSDGCPRDASCPMSAYADLDMYAWYHDGVHYCLEEGLMDGVGEGLFAPGEATSRAMIVTILWRLEGCPEAAAPAGFADVAPGAWYADAIAWAVSAGVAEGYSESEFGPNDPITREQLAAMLWRYAQSKDYDVGAGEGMVLPDFEDFAKISEYAVPAMQWACSSGVITGVTDSTIEPQGTATRAQAATMFGRFLGYVGG